MITARWFTFAVLIVIFVLALLSGSFWLVMLIMVAVDVCGVTLLLAAPRRHRR